MLNTIKRQIKWLEHRNESMKKAATTIVPSSDYERGFDNGILFAVKQYEKEIKELCQLIEGFLIEDVDLSGGEEAC